MVRRAAASLQQSARSHLISSAHVRQLRPVGVWDPFLRLAGRPIASHCCPLCQPHTKSRVAAVAWGPSSEQQTTVVQRFALLIPHCFRSRRDTVCVCACVCVQRGEEHKLRTQCVNYITTTKLPHTLLPLPLCWQVLQSIAEGLADGGEAAGAVRIGHQPQRGSGAAGGAPHPAVAAPPFGDAAQGPSLTNGLPLELGELKKPGNLAGLLYAAAAGTNKGVFGAPSSGAGSTAQLTLHLNIPYTWSRTTSHLHPVPIPCTVGGGDQLSAVEVADIRRAVMEATPAPSGQLGGQPEVVAIAAEARQRWTKGLARWGCVCGELWDTPCPMGMSRMAEGQLAKQTASGKPELRPGGFVQQGPARCSVFCCAIAKCFPAPVSLPISMQRPRQRIAARCVPAVAPVSMTCAFGIVCIKLSRPTCISCMQPAEWSSFSSARPTRTSRRSCINGAPSPATRWPSMQAAAGPGGGGCLSCRWAGAQVLEGVG